MSLLERPQRVSAAEASARIHEYTKDHSTRLREPDKGSQIDGTSVPSKCDNRTLVRIRLLKVIESAIGRKIFKRDRKPINPLYDDLEHPNLYKWIFTTEYPHFPPGSVYSWSRPSQDACIKAINQGLLSVLALPSEAADHPSHERVDVSDSSEDQRHPSSTNEGIDGIANEQNNLDQHTRLPRKQIEGNHDISSLRESCSKIGDLVYKIKAARREYATRREEADQREEAVRREDDEQLATNLKHVLRLKEDIIGFAESKIKLLEEAARGQSFGNQQLKTRCEEVQKEYVQVRNENLSLKQRLDHYLDDLGRERQLGEIRDLRTELQCLRDENDAKRKRYEIQSRRERQVIADLKIEIDNLRSQLEESQENHAHEISRARMEGRREDEALNQLLKGHNLHYEGRKRREIRTIYNNWKNIPQNILPKLMLPDGVPLGDKTLYLLARLSRVEHDPNKATALLQRAVELRNSQLAIARQDPTIGKADIEKVLSDLKVTDSSQVSSETCSASQTEPSREMRSVRDVIPCHNHSGRTRSSALGVEKASGATSSCQEENYNSMSLPDAFHDISTMKTNRTQVPALESQRQMTTGQRGSTSSINRTIEENINKLRAPLEHLIPSSLEHFPLKIINKAVRGDNIEPEVLPLPWTSQILDQDTEDNIQREDGLPSSSILVIESEVGRTNRYTPETNDAAERHSRSGASGGVRNDSPFIFEIQGSSQVTSTSAINISSGSESPDYVASTENGRWDVHATRNLQLSLKAGSAAEQPFHGAQTPSTLIRHSDEEDYYDATPPRRVSRIFAPFARTKKRTLSVYEEDAEDAQF